LLLWNETKQIIVSEKVIEIVVQPMKKSF